MASRVDGWTSEADYFDHAAQESERKLRPVDPRTLHRYGRLRRRRFSKEYGFRLLGDLKGKRVLDVGCGDGINSVTMSMLGAEVTGVDISSGAIALAKQRMWINDVSERVHLHCAPIELASFASNSFDIIWCHAILHHVIPDLEAVMSRIVDWAKPGAQVIIMEPINLSSLLRKLRLALFRSPEATCGERPLERREIELLTQLIPGLRVRHFRALGRLEKLILPDGQYETAAFWRRLLYSLLLSVDWVLLSIPVFAFSASTAVFVGTIRK